MSKTRKPPETVAGIAKAILQLYRDDPKRWIKTEYAATSPRMKTTVDFSSSKARCWCLMGACYRVTGYKLFHKFGYRVSGEPPVIVDFKKKIQEITGLSAVDFNDARTTRFRDVRAALRKVAKVAKVAKTG